MWYKKLKASLIEKAKSKDFLQKNWNKKQKTKHFSTIHKRIHSPHPYDIISIKDLTAKFHKWFIYLFIFKYKAQMLFHRCFALGARSP